MWTVIVEVTLVFAQDRTGVALAVDQDPVGALSPDAANKPFRETIRAGRLRRSLDDVDAFGGEHRVERSGKLRARRSTTGSPVGRGRRTLDAVGA
jgi:hypothetical protein